VRHYFCVTIFLGRRKVVAAVIIVANVRLVVNEKSFWGNFLTEATFRDRLVILEIAA
jgi:hypothetical protein